MSEKRTRELTFSVGPVDEKNRTARLTFSSETPVDRGDVLEVLDHSEGSVRLGRLTSKAAVLINHDSNQQVGVVESASIQGRRGSAVVRFGKSKQAEEAFQDVKDGIRTLISVQYVVHKSKAEQREDGRTVVRVTDWEPLEISIVSIPADHTVGVGRSEAKHQTKIEVMDSSPTQKKSAEILGIADGYAKLVPNINRLAHRAISENMSGEQFAQLCLDNLPKVTPSISGNGYGSRPAPTIDEMFGGGMQRNLSDYRLTRAIAGFNDGKLDGLEGETSQEIARAMGKAPKGIYVPITALAGTPERGRRDWTAGDSSAGGRLVGSEIMGNQFIDVLRNNLYCAANGATMLGGLRGNVSIPKKLTTTSAYWKAETVETDESTGTVGQLNGTPHAVSIFTEYSKELLMQASLDVEQMVRFDIAETLGVEIDRAALNGTGASGEPVGILNQTGLNQVTFGGAPTWAKVLNFKTKLAEDNADRGRLARMSTPAVEEKWKSTLKETADAGAGYLWNPDQETVNRFPIRVTNQLSNGKVIFGNWTDLVLLSWGILDVQPDPYTKARQRLIGLTVTDWVDVIVRRPESFCVSTDSGAQ